MGELIGRQLGQYQVRSVIRRGGMSTIYKAWQPSLDRWVAVKVLSNPGDPQFASRFRREARAIAALQHPNILPVHDYGEQDDLAWLVVQYVEGGHTLADLLGGPLEPAAGVKLVVGVLEALGYAHDRGIVHRDVKPGNVLLPSPSWPMLADFGIAKLLLDTDTKHLTQQGLVVGTAAYMAPEQAFGLAVDARTDLYAAGVVLYETLTGRVPFEGDTPMSVLMQQAYERPPPPRNLNPSLEPELERVLLRALAKDPEDRYQSAAEMADELRAAVPAEVVLPRTDPPPAEPDSKAASYAAAVHAFTEGRWSDSIERLSPLVAEDPGYEDAEEILEAATAARESAERPAQPSPPPDAAGAARPVPSTQEAKDRVDSAAPAALPPSSNAQQPSRAWLLPVVLFAVFALAGPTVIAKRQFDLHQPTPAQAATGRGTGGAAPAAASATVDMVDLAFKPATLVVRKGATVTFANHDVAPHTVTADAGPVDSGVIQPGGVFSLQLTANLRYHCSIHPGMTASIVVAT